MTAAFTSGRAKGAEERRSHTSTLGARADMLATARPRPVRVSMTAEREFYDGEVVPGTRYRVIGLLGSGGMGTVYEVEHIELGKRFVLKALLRGLANRDDLVRRLRNEWRALGQLEHVNIVGVTDAGVTNTGIPYFVMERLMGETLSSRLRRERRLRVSDALSIAADVLEGLSAAHSLGIVHRDVKPPNVFLVANRPAKLLDFGIAKMLDPKASQITGRGIAIGTPRYMSPEQTTGSPVDARSDLYSTGVILFEMIAGGGPFDHARDGNELFLAQLTQAPPPVSRYVPVPKELDATLLRLLAKKPGDRPESAALVAAEFRALSKALKNEPGINALPPDDTTIPGGPFDTLEGAATIPSESAADPQVHAGSGVSHRPGPHTFVGMPGQRSPKPPSAAAPRPRTPTGADGATLRLEIVGSDTDGVTTHTAFPRPMPIVETPPPVEPGMPSVAPTSQTALKPRRRAIAVAAAIGACGLAASVVVAARRSPSEGGVTPSLLTERPGVAAMALEPPPQPPEKSAAIAAEPAREVAPAAVEAAPAPVAPRLVARLPVASRAPIAKKQAKTSGSAAPKVAPAPAELASKKAAAGSTLPSSGL